MKISSVPEFKFNPEYSNCIWQLWLQGDENKPDIVKRCMNSVQKFSGNRKVITLSEKNLNEYIELPDFILFKYKKGIISKTHLSDYIRLVLLAKYGGTWIDATCFQTSEIPQDILNSDFFIFKSEAWMTFPTPPDNLDFLDYIQPFYGQVYHAGSSWFIHAQPNSPIILTALEMLNEYWRNNNKMIDYFLVHNLITLSIMSSETNKDSYNKMPSYSTKRPHILYFSQFKKFNLNAFNNMKKWSFIHKLTYKKPQRDILEDSFMKYILYN